MKRNSGIISSSRLLSSREAAPGIFDLFDNKNARTANIWPINYSISNISLNGGTTYENTEYTINVNSIGVESPGQIIYWEIILGTNSNSSQFSSTSGSFTQSSGSQTGSFTFRLNYTGDPNKGTANWQIRLREDAASGRILFTSNVFSTPAISLNSSWSTNPVNEGGGTYLYLSINNCGNYTTNYHYIGYYTGTTSQWVDFSSYSTFFYLYGITLSFYYQLASDLTTEGTEYFQFALYSGQGYNLGTISSLTVNDTSLSPVASVNMTGGVTSDTVNEGSTVSFTSTLTNFSSGTLYWTISAAAQITNSDFSSPANTVTDGGNFTVSSSTGFFNLTINSDYFTEGTENFIVQIRTNSTSGTIIGQSATITINDTTETPIATISLSSTTIDEGSTVTATINTTNYPSGTLYWDIVDFTGNYRISDFSEISGSISISSSTGSFTVTAASDGFTEGAESFKIRIRHLIPTTSTYVNVVTSDIINITDTSTGTTEPTIPIGEDLTTTFRSFAQYVVADNLGDTNANYSVGEIQQNYSGSGRLYLIHKCTGATSFYNDAPIACIQIVSADESSIVEQWYFGYFNDGRGWTTHTGQYNFGNIGAGINITPNQASSNYSYSTSVVNGTTANLFALVTSTGSSSTGAVDGIALPTAPMTVGQATVPQSISTYYMMRETSGATVPFCSLCRSPSRIWTAGERIRVAYIIGNISTANYYTPTDTFFIGIAA